jgi:hypothetical protein
MTICSNFRVRLFLWFIILISANPGKGFADARIDYLLDMLRNGKNYRLREQAATTLGKLRAHEAVPDLVRATRDPNELVIISAAIALKQIGDASVMEELEESLRRAPTKAARSQLRVTLAALKELRRSSRPETGVKATPRYLVRVDSMGNSSKERRYDLVETMRKIVLSRIDQESDVVLQNPGMTEKQVRNKLKKEKLVGYIVSGSIIRLERVDNRLIVKLGLNVFTNPDYNLLMMPTTEATITTDTVIGQPRDEKKELTKAIQAVADSLVGEVFSSLRRADL